MDSTSRLGALLWGSLVSCGRLSIGPTRMAPRASAPNAAVANRRAGCQPAPHRASDSTFMSCARLRVERRAGQAPNRSVARRKRHHLGMGFVAGWVTIAPLDAPCYGLRGVTLEPYGVLDNRARLQATCRGRAEAGQEGTGWK